MFSVGRLAWVLVALAALSSAATARAQDAAATDADKHIIGISGKKPIAAFSLRAPDGSAIVEHCDNPCSVMLPGSRIRLELFDASGQPLGRRALRVSGDELWLLDAPDRTQRDLGIGLGVVGIALLGVGGTTWLVNTGVDGPKSDSQSTWSTVGLLSALAGGIMIAVAAPMFFGNLRPSVRITPGHWRGRSAH